MSEVSQKLVARVNGRDWFLYGVDFKTHDGTFSTYIYAISDEHAQMVVQELRETATLAGRIHGVYPTSEGGRDG